jgi:hypothetical protein
MAEERAKGGVFKVLCPCCEATLWVDAATEGVIKSERAAKKKSSLDDLLLREKKKAEGMDHKLEATFELQKKKHDEAEARFKSALDRKDEKES